MLSHKSALTNFISYSVLLVLFLLTAGLAGAQTPMESADKLKAAARPLEAVSGATNAGATLASPAADPAAAEPTAAAADSVRPEADPLNAKAAPPKAQPLLSPPPPPAQCRRTIQADVVALAQPIMLNRLGAAIPGGMVFALKRDTVRNGNQVQLGPDKRPRPLVLRANVGDCLTITLTNAIPKSNFIVPAPPPDPPAQPYNTSEVSLHVQGMEWVAGSQDDGSFVGANNSSLASASATPNPAPTPPQTQTYKLFAREEGTFLLYTMGDTTSVGNQLREGLFGALNVQPAGAEWYRSQVTADDLALATYNANRLGPNTLNCPTPTNCTLTIAGSPARQVKVIKTASGYLNTLDNHPLINYAAVYPAKRDDGTPIAAQMVGTPILKVLDASNNIVHSDLTAMITGPNAGRFPGTTGPNNPEPPCNAENKSALKPANGKVDPLFCANPASPDRKQPYREVTIIYHGALDPVATQAFPILNSDSSVNPLANTTVAGQDAFAINYGTGGIGAEIYANRVGVGPMGGCVDCKFEEFFLSAWSVGDPATLVDVPANVNVRPPLPPTPAQPPVPPPPPLCTTADFENPSSLLGAPKCANARQPATGFPYTLAPLVKATRAYYPDDPSNVYHSYINDHVKFRILHGGTDVTHVHHQHAHQWLQSPNSDESSYLDSQMISPGASYTLEMVYNGSGNRNKVVGDSIFHCHFYPHFAAGMWAMWRTHDVFESGTQLANGIPVTGARALPDGEIQAGTPIPAVVPLPTLPMAPLPSPVFIEQGQIVYGTPQAPDKTGQSVTVNPGFPFFIPGLAGARAPHPPLDFAPDGSGFMDGGLPRHLVTGGSVAVESHDAFDWSKDLATMKAVQLPEDGTPVEKVAMTFFGRRCYATFFPDGTPGSCPSSNSTPPQSTLNAPPTGFLLNGLPRGPQPGAPFADPAVDDNGNPVGLKRTYKAAAIQMKVFLNTKGWHYPQQRMLTLWNDVSPTIARTRPPEPLFFRGNSGDIIEYWHTNLVPNYYLVDDFQVRTPTDILGQHIHLVKFDVTSSDGAGNGFNYEDGTFSPEEVQEMIAAIKKPGGSWTHCAGCTTDLRAAQKPPADICAVNPKPQQCTTEWLGAQTTIQRWYLDPLVDDSGVDRTMRTVFTHDHFGPSTHQQAGLYAGLLIEPTGSSWRNSEDGSPMGRPATQAPIRADGGPTSWKADVLTTDSASSYREFALEFQDLQLAYQPVSIKCANCSPITGPNADHKKGWMDPNFAINAPSTPSLITTGLPLVPAGTQSVNYRNAPLGFRLGSASVFNPPSRFSDMSFAYDNSIQQTVNPPVNPGDTADPTTPLMRAYQNDNVQVRVLVGAHVFAHQFNLEGPTWFAEPAWKNSGYRSSQAMGLSEHFELLFRVPSSSAPKNNRKCPDGMSQANCVDYLYSPSLDDSGLANGLWGLFRAYDPTVKTIDPKTNKVNLQPLPNNPIGPSANVTYATCPAGAVPRVFNVTAVTAQKALALVSPRAAPKDTTKGQIVFNNRGTPQDFLVNELGLMYVRTEDLDSQGRLKAGVPIEPLVLRANAGDCIEVNLANGLPSFPNDPSKDSEVFKQSFSLAPPFNGPPYPTKASRYVGLHPQLLAYDATQSNGINVGWNSQGQGDQVVAPGDPPITYHWYAGKIERDATGKQVHTPVEFGSLNLFPSDPVFHHINGLYGAMIIQPQGSTWQCDAKDKTTGKLKPVPCDPTPGFDPSTVKDYTRAAATVTLADHSKFREFALMITDDIGIFDTKDNLATPQPGAVNYRTEPWPFRYANNLTGDFSCMLSNQLTQQQDPKTPVFTAEIGDKVRFRLTHPFGTGTSQVFSLHGHVWQRNPYTNDSQGLGNNNLSQWIGSRDNHGPTDHFDLLIDKAGGEGGKAGDYLYALFVDNQVRQGAWGIFRVGHSNGQSQANAACKVIPPGQPYKPAPPKDDSQRFTRPPVLKNP